MRATFKSINFLSEPKMLDADDFSRLGIPLNEYRAPVIRRAAARNARSIAKRLLLRGDDNSVNQLTDLSVAAYRLLDPRRRGDDHARAYVGRILPQALSASNPIRFLGKSTRTEPNSELFQRPRTGETSTEKPDADFPVHPKHFSVSEVTDALCDQDLLRQTKFKRMLRRISLSGAIASTVLLTTLLVAALLLVGRQETVEKTLADSAVAIPSIKANPSTSDERSLGGSSSEGNVSVSGRTSAELVPAADAVGSTASMSQTRGIIPRESPIPAVAPESSLDGIAIDIPSAVNPVEPKQIDSESQLDQTEQLDFPKQEDAPKSFADDSEKGDDPFLKDPFAAIALHRSTGLDRATAPYRSSAAGRSDDSTLDPAIEDTQRVEETSLDSSLETNGNVATSTLFYDMQDQDDAREVIDSLRAATLDPNAGVRVQAMFQSAVAMWWTMPVDDVVKALEGWDKGDQKETIVDESLSVAFERAILPEVQIFLIDQAADFESLLHGRGMHHRFEQMCSAMTVWTRSLGDFDGTEKLLAMRQSAERFEVLASKAGSVQQTMDREDAISARYWAFVRQRWVDVLPALTKSSDRRIAAAAESELNLTSQSSDTSRQLVAKRWVGVASRVDDAFESDQIRQHADRLVR